MKLKAGVRLGGIVPQLVMAALIVERVFQRYGVECVITSANDSKHSTESWHYKGRALDFRTKYDNLNGMEDDLRNDVKAALGDDFDVVMEAVGTENEHLHLEYDPKVQA